ncbi:MAG: MFS transporter [Rhodospirillales bacterium]|nr:MFS transporter [Rhodospirillales bacterium]
MSDPAAHETRKAVAAAAIGNVLEWYDFGVYVFFAVDIGHNFFPNAGRSVALLASFAVFGVGFLARPVGGIVLGRLGDTRGRKLALTLTIAMMAVGTIVIGILPTYASIGIAAPVLLVLARLLQGFSAGGEWGGSTAFMVEWAPASRRGWYGSWQQSSIAASLVLSSAVGGIIYSALPHSAVTSWGWRLPFLGGIVIAVVGFYLRRQVEETPVYRAYQERSTAAPAHPERDFLLGLKAFGFTIHWTVAFYIFLSYMPTFMRLHGHLSAAAALWSNTIGLIVLMVLIPPLGALSDRIGRKTLLLISCAAFIVLPIPFFRVILGNPGFITVAFLQMIFGASIAFFSGPGPAAIAELFPTSSRSTWMTPAYALAVAIFGGFAPFIATWLIGLTGSPMAPTYYVIAAAVVSFLVILSFRETAHAPLA